MTGDFIITHKCPACGGVVTRRSKHHGADRFHLVRVPYRCRGCRHRFWAVSTRAWAIAVSLVLLAMGTWAAVTTWSALEELNGAARRADEIDRAGGFGLR